MGNKHATFKTEIFNKNIYDMGFKTSLKDCVLDTDNFISPNDKNVPDNDIDTYNLGYIHGLRCFSKLSDNDKQSAINSYHSLINDRAKETGIIALIPAYEMMECYSLVKSCYTKKAFDHFGKDPGNLYCEDFPI